VLDRTPVPLRLVRAPAVGSILAMQTPLTRVLNGPHPKRPCVTMPSGYGVGAGVIACAEIARAKKPATAINLIILRLPIVDLALI